jgi:hypothetical protein
MHGPVDAADELLERPFGSDAVLRQLATERRGDLLGPRVTHVPFGDRLEVPRGLARRQIEDLRHLGGVGSGHRRILPALGAPPSAHEP